MSRLYSNYSSRLMLTCILAFASILFSNASYASEPDRASIKRIAVKVYLYGYPILLMDRTSQVLTADKNGVEGQFKNQLRHIQVLADPTFRAVVRPNNDTLYSSAFLDLKKEAVVLTIPKVRGRYFSFALLDAWTNVFTTLGSGAFGRNENETYPASFAITGPNWKGEVPDGVQRIKSPTNLVWLMGRTEVKDQNDITDVIAIQAKYKLQLFSRYKNNSEPALSIRGRIPAQQNLTPNQQVRAMDGETFYTNLSRLINENPPHAVDAGIMKQLAVIGIIPGQQFNFSALPSDLQDVLNESTQAAQKFMKFTLGRIASDEQWTPDLTKSRLGKYGTRYGFRAIIADVGFGAIKKEDAAYQTARKDTQRRPLNGNNAYRIRFPKGKTPPTQGFWSLSIYDKQGYFVANVLNRYSIGSNSKMQYNRDGSLDIYIQHSPPSSSKQSNWLPAPYGPFSIMLRMYRPAPAILNGSWKMPKLETVK